MGLELAATAGRLEQRGGGRTSIRLIKQLQFLKAEDTWGRDLGGSSCKRGEKDSVFKCVRGAGDR